MKSHSAVSEISGSSCVEAKLRPDRPSWVLMRATNSHSPMGMDEAMRSIDTYLCLAALNWVQRCRGRDGSPSSVSVQAQTRAVPAELGVTRCQLRPCAEKRR
jgi:hypothetical protein